MFDTIDALAERNGFLSLDLETTGLDYRSVDILLIALSAGFGNLTRSVAVTPTKAAIDFVVKTLKDPKMRVIGHNIFKFDLQVLHYAGIIPFGDIKAKVIDTLPLVWLLDENIRHDLKGSVKKYLKADMTPYDEAYISSPALQRIKAIEIEMKSLRRAAAKIPARARKSSREWMKTAYAEEKLLQEGGEAEKTTKKALMEKIRAAGAELLQRLSREEKEKFEAAVVEMESRKTAAETEAQAEQKAYARDDAYQTRRLYSFCRRFLVDNGLSRWADMELQVRRISTEMEITGVYIDQDRLEALKAEVEPLLNEFENDIYNLAKRQFKITSPDQLAEVLYDDLRIPQAGGIRIDKTGKEIDEARSTKEALLSRMRHPIAQKVLNYRALFKLKTAFLTKLLSQVRAGGDRRIHPVYNTTVRTGRWSCKKPNVQQIPSKKKAQEYDQRILGLGPKLRSVFTAPSGKKFIGGDLSQIELRLAAHFTQDYNLLKVYSESKDFGGIRYYTGDIHDMTSKSLGVPRKIAKNINFGLCYGMSAKGFARYARLYKEGTDIFDIERAEAFRDGFMELYSGIPDFLDRLQKTREGQFVKTKFQTISGRFRRFPKEDNAFPGKIFNSIIQGSAADILKVIVWALDACIVKNPKFAGTELVLQVHDEVGLYVPEEMANRVAVLTKYIMEARWFETEVPVLASVKICDDWSGKDDDYIPEVGILYAKLSDKGVVTDRIFTSSNWKEFADFEEAAKKDEKAKKPANESKIVLVKPCVAMLTDAQNRWAAQFVKVEDFTFHGDEGKFVKEG